VERVSRLVVLSLSASGVWTNVLITSLHLSIRCAAYNIYVERN
jgi:hypothetical protein